MSKSRSNSPLLGYNTNVRHGGLLFHIQTEDSGLGHPHIITHLFVDGTILATKKTSYATVLGQGNLEDVVRQMMRDQHRQMFVELRDGVHDSLAEQVLGVQLQTEPRPDRMTSAAPDAADAESPEEEEPVRAEARVQVSGTGDSQVVRVVIPAAMDPKDKTDGKPPEKGRSLRGRSIFDTPEESGGFGEERITDKSLDEVILSYLTEEELEE